MWYQLGDSNSPTQPYESRTPNPRLACVNGGELAVSISKRVLAVPSVFKTEPGAAQDNSP